MYCRYCGTQNADNAKFCRSCGKIINGGNVTIKPPKFAAELGEKAAPMIEKASEKASEKAIKVAKKAKTISGKYILIGIAAIAFIIVATVVLVNDSRKINLNDYVQTEFQGYDGSGTAEFSIDWSEIQSKYGEKLKLTAEPYQNSIYEDFSDFITPMDVLRDGVRIYMKDPGNGYTNGKLSMGDRIRYIIEVDNDMTNSLNYKILYEDGECTVSALDPVNKIDAFKDVEIRFEGMEPNGEANLRYSGQDFSEYDFYISQYDGLSNGDKIIVTFDEASAQNYAETIGMMPQETEKTYTVSGLGKYVRKLDDIPKDDMDAMVAQGDDVYHAYAAKEWNSEESQIASFTPIGSYLLTSKDQDKTNGNNYLFLIYYIQIRNRYSNEEDTYDRISDSYWFIRYKDLRVNGDGNLIFDITDYKTPSNSFKVESTVKSGWYSRKTWNFDGYPTLSELYNSVVTQNLDSYEHEDNVDEETPVKAAMEALPAPEEETAAASDLELTDEETEKETEKETQKETKAAKNGWIKENGTFYYYKNDLKVTGWIQDGNKWYYCDTNGKMVTNAWRTVSGSDYYFGSDGAMLVDATTPDGYSVGSDGKRIKEETTKGITGSFKYDDGNEYYEDEDSGEITYHYKVVLKMNKNGKYTLSVSNGKNKTSYTGTYNYDPDEDEETIYFRGDGIGATAYYDTECIEVMIDDIGEEVWLEK